MIYDVVLKNKETNKDLVFENVDKVCIDYEEVIIKFANGMLHVVSKKGYDEVEIKPSCFCE